MITRTRATQLRKLIERAAASLNDEDALAAVTLFPEWDGNGHDYAVNDRFEYGSKLYRVVQAHTSQPDWTPDATPALYTEVAHPGEIPVWRQPTGAQDAYQTGDKVHYPTEEDPVYRSTVNDNVWPPDVFGWELDS